MITIISKTNCTQCNQAKMLLDMKQTQYDVKMLGVDFSREQLMDKYPSARSFPLILKDGEYIGGLAELKQLLA